MNTGVGIHADIGPTTEILTKALRNKKYGLSKNSPWWQELNAKTKKNKEVVDVSAKNIYLYFLTLGRMSI